MSTVTSEARFDEVFDLISTVNLAVSPTNPIGAASSVTIWNGDYVVADGIQSDLKVFARDGRLKTTIGRAGDGPAEFRQPIGLATPPSGRLVVLDRRMRLSTFDSSADYLGRVDLPWVSPQQLWSYSDPRGRELLLVSARLTSARGRSWGAHAVTPRGKVLRSFHELSLAADNERFRNNFIEVRAVPVGPYIVTLDQTTNVVERTDLRTGEIVTFALNAEWYEAPRWPESNIGIDELTDWANGQMWGRTLLPIGRREVLVGFSRYRGSEGVPELRYAILNVENGHLEVVSDPAQARFKMSRGDTLYEVSLDDGGEAMVRVFLFQR
jgi:6-bladed beta-propeller